MKTQAELRADPETERKLARSRAGAEKLQLRTVRCPRCGFYLLDVYGRDHCYVRVKCRKCKFSDTIDTALFRTPGGKRARGETRRG